MKNNKIKFFLLIITLERGEQGMGIQEMEKMIR